MKGRALVVCAALLLVAEGGLRASGRGPWRPFDDLQPLPTLPDPELGWRNRPGLQPLIQPDGSRGQPRAEGTPVVLLGGSFVYGLGLADEDALHGRLQVERPDLSVRNHGVPGYGTVQSLLLARRLPLDGATVVYGLVELHEARNVAAPSWRRGLDRAAQGETWGVPSAHWDGTRLHFLPPRSYHHWALSERVALVDAAERAWVGLLDWGTAHKTETTVQLIRALRDEVEARGGRFLVATLDLPTQRAFYVRRLDEAGIDHLDLPVEGRLPDGHPDAATHRAWARALGSAL